MRPDVMGFRTVQQETGMGHNAQMRLFKESVMPLQMLYECLFKKKKVITRVGLSTYQGNYGPWNG